MPFWAFSNLMGRATRFELATFGTTNRRSNQLSYARQTFVHWVLCFFFFWPAFAVLKKQNIFQEFDVLRRGTEFSALANASVKIRGGADQTRTDDPLHAMQVLYQLSYNPVLRNLFYISSCKKSNIFANLFTWNKS